MRVIEMERDIEITVERKRERNGERYGDNWRERERLSVCVCVKKTVRVCVCLFVGGCACERERERKTENVCVCACVCGCARVGVGVRSCGCVKHFATRDKSQSVVSFLLEKISKYLTFQIFLRKKIVKSVFHTTICYLTDMMLSVYFKLPNIIFSVKRTKDIYFPLCIMYSQIIT